MPFLKSLLVWILSFTLVSSYLPVIHAQSQADPVESRQEERESSRVLIVLDLEDKTAKVSPEELSGLSGMVVTMLRRDLEMSIVDQRQFLQLAGLAQDSFSLGCDDNAKCIVDLMGAVKSDYVLSGRITAVQETFLITLQLLDVRTASSSTQVSLSAARPEEFKQVLAQAANEMAARLRGEGALLTFDFDALGEAPSFAVLDLAADGDLAALASSLTDVITYELKMFRDLRVVSRAEIQALLEWESTRQAVTDCTDISCFAEIGQALGVQYLVTGSLGKLEDTYVISLRTIDIRKAVVVARAKETFMGPADDLLIAIRFGLRRMIGFTPAGVGRLRLGVEPKEAALRLNGEDIGTALALKLPEGLEPGRYRVAAQAEDYFPLERDIYIEPGRLSDVTLMLEERPAQWWETWWFWTLVGAVVVGGVTAGAVIGTLPENKPDTGSGQIILRRQ